MVEKDGGPVFPRVANHVDSFGFLHQESNGMSIRDYFAAAALQALMNEPPPPSFTLSEVASKAYRLADAMLRAREASHE
ncbi:MAG: hypothetical protein KGO94_14080 [Alphaproteobacteria bacterium]|nr:hypothetical protein [Alphaproteobacteria bacterium]